MLSGAILVLSAVIVGQGNEPQKDWMRFLPGEWTYEYKAMLAAGKPVKGEVKYTSALKRQAVVARGKEADDEWIELIGWQPDTKTISTTGYGVLNNNYWIGEYHELSSDKISGKTKGVLPDGRQATGKVALIRVDDDTFEVHLEFLANGEKLSDVGTFKRKK